MRTAALVLLLLTFGAAPARADPAAVHISPITIEFAPARKVAAVRVRNSSSESVAFEARAHAWSQDNGRDVLTETNDVVVAPPAFIIAPGRTQIVRLGLANAAREENERAYRLLLTQVQLAMEDETGGLAMRLQFSLPVFAPPEHDRGAPRLEALTGDEAGVRIVNESAQRIVIHEAEVSAANETARLKTPRYVLAGQRIDVSLPMPGAVKLGYTDAAGERAEISLAARAP